jgi:flagellin
MASNANRNIGINSTNASKSMAKLSSGLRINSAADDAAGLGISEKMKGQINGLDQATSNAQDGISMVQTAEGALNETTSILQRMKQLATQASNGTTTSDDRSSIQDEMNQLTSEINRIGNTTEFNTQKVLNGGIGSTDGQKITKATSAAAEFGAFTATVGNVGAKVTVDNTTFDLSTVAATKTETIASVISDLKNVTSGGTKLSDLVDITNDAGKIKITDKSQGASSSVTLTMTSAAGSSIFGAGTATSTSTVNGDPTLIEKAGLQASTALTAADTTIAAGATINVKVGTNSNVEVSLNDGVAAKTYLTSTGADANVKASAMADVITDLNASLQKAGLSDKVEASLSKDNKVQFISKTGDDISVSAGTGTPLTTGLGFAAADETAVKNVEQVAGPGAQGTGFNTTFQIGANTGQTMSLTINDMRAAALGITGNAGQSGFTTANTVTDGTTNVTQEAALNVMTTTDASNAISTIDKAISAVSTERGKLGATENRLDHTINNLGVASQNLTTAESRITDVDMASEYANYSKYNVESQAAQAMLAQANQQPQQILQLLR